MVFALWFSRMCTTWGATPRINAIVLYDQTKASCGAWSRHGNAAPDPSVTVCCCASRQPGIQIPNRTTICHCTVRFRQNENGHGCGVAGCEWKMEGGTVPLAVLPATLCQTLLHPSDGNRSRSTFYWPTILNIPGGWIIHAVFDIEFH